jgi:hypothetical protein
VRCFTIVKAMFASITDWAVVVVGMAVVVGTVIATFLLVVRFVRHPGPSRPRTRRGSGQFEPPAPEEDA